MTKPRKKIDPKEFLDNALLFDEFLERRDCYIHYVGERSALDNALRVFKQRAGEAFAERNDDQARLLREVCDTLQKMRNEVAGIEARTKKVAQLFSTDI